MALPTNIIYITNVQPQAIIDVAGHLIEFLIDMGVAFSVLTKRIGNHSNHKEYVMECQSFPGGSAVKKEFTYQCRRLEFDPWVRKIRNGNSLQCSCLGNSMDRGAWQAIVHGVARVRHDLATKQQQSVREETRAWFPGTPSVKHQWLIVFTLLSVCA